MNLKKPVLPDRWSTSYVSYWQPMLEDDELTSGYCWFDYKRQICRIDGMFNPWSEKKTGHKLWMSEVGNAFTQRTVKYKMAYAKETIGDNLNCIATPLEKSSESFKELFLTQDSLVVYDAEFAGTSTVMEHVVDAWSYKAPNKSPVTLYFIQGTNHLVRMVTGDPSVHASVRDFLNFNTEEIPDCIFDKNNK